MTPEERKKLDEQIKGLEQKRIYYDAQSKRVSECERFIYILENRYFPDIVREIWASSLIDKRHDSFYDKIREAVEKELEQILEYERDLLNKLN